MNVTVIKPGLLTTLQDLGRPGFAHLGVGRAGAFDLPALRIANALCGNPPDAAALEITLLGPTLHFQADSWIAVTGAPIPFTTDGAAQPTWAPVHVPRGAMVAFGAIGRGCRSYLAVQGAMDVEPVLGSRSTDVNAALGPVGGQALRAGGTLPVGSGSVCSRNSRTADGAKKNGPAPVSWRLDPRPWFHEDPRTELRLLAGRHLDKLERLSCSNLFSHTFIVENDSNRVGVRLSGPRLEWDASIEMVSEGCVPGLLQLPPSGQPIAFGPECPVSGGYPRIGQIAAVDIPRLAQLRPGDAVRFRPCTLEEAIAALQKREHALGRLEAAIRRRLQMDSGFRCDEPAAAPG